MLIKIGRLAPLPDKSSGIEETVLTRKGGTVYGDVIAPNITKIQNETTSIKNTLNSKVNIAQGAENAGKILTVDNNGNVVVGEGGGGASLPILMSMWSDHVINNMSWLRADTFSWHDGEKYKAAYNHLASDLESGGEKLYAWQGAEMYTDTIFYTKTETPASGDLAYDANGIVNNNVDIVNSPTMIDGAIAVNINLEPEIAFIRSPSNDTTAPEQLIDTIGDITITYCQADDGHKICLPDQESNLVALYEATGVAWYYVLDTANKQFKLPRTKWGFTGLRDSAGGYVDQDVLLPNITGTITGDLTPRGDGSYGTTGAFTHTTATVYGKGASSNTTYFRSISLSASRSSSVYSGDGTNTLIQPRGTQMYLYFYVGNFEQSAIEQTAGINAEMFNDLNAHKVIEVQNPTEENGYSWYRKYADGWVEQGGKLTGATAYDVTFMIPFSGLAYVASATLLYTNTGTICQVGLVNRTGTGMKVAIADNTQGNDRPACWQASGLAA